MKWLSSIIKSIDDNTTLKGIIVSILILHSMIHATIWYVHPDSILNSIQVGLNACSIDDTVLVASGTYFENIIWPNTQGIDLVSESGSSATIIDGDSAGSVITIANNIDSTSIIKGFTIQNGAAVDGGGIYCDSSSPIITRNIITSNKANIISDGRGGGIFCTNGSPIIISNTIANNIAFQGGGISCWDYASPSIIKNLITLNTATDNSGGGILCTQWSSYTITGNDISHNTAEGFGGGILIAVYSSGTIKYNTIDSNTAGVAGGGIDCSFYSSPIILGNSICYNRGTDWQRGGIEIVTGCSPIIDSCTIAHNNGEGITTYDNCNAVIHYSNIFDNTGYGINSWSNNTVNAEYNWWGDPSGPGGVGPGTGDEVSMGVDYDPWLDHPVGVKEHGLLPCKSSNLQVSSNPFSKQIYIKWQTNGEGAVLVKIFDTLGRMVRKFDNISNNAITWDGNDGFGRRLPGGVYFLEFKVNVHRETKKILLIR